MKKNFRKLFRGIFLTSMTSLANTHGAEAMPKYLIADNDNDDDVVELSKIKNVNSVKLLLKFSGSDDYELAAHRSHSSHRSHRSGSGGGHYSHMSHSSHSSSSSHYSSATSSSSSSRSSRTYSLGERTIRHGVSGLDVKELSDLLLKHDYITTSDLDKDTDGHIRCNTTMTKAIKSFQQDAKLTADGIAGNTTIQKLKSWHNLGDRLLKRGMTGHDVTQLKNILIAKKFLTGALVKGEILFDELIENAVREFQNGKGIDATGQADTQTIFFLKKQ